MERCIVHNLRISHSSPLYRLATTSTRAFTTTPRDEYKNKPRLSQNQSNRGKIARVSGRYSRTLDLSGMTSDISLATVPTADTPHTCLLLRHDKGRYLFGRVSEGTQRAISSRGLSFGGVSNVFLSGSVGWDQIGGLPGLLLTIGGAVKAQEDTIIAENAERERRGRKLLSMTVNSGVRIHAGENISHALASLRGIITRQPVKVRIDEHREDQRKENVTNLEPDWSDEAFKVWNVPVARERSSSPRKRIRLDESASEQDGEFKESTSLSDPEVAKFVVEEYLWNGQLAHLPLLQRGISELKADDIAIVFEDGTAKLYKGPYASDGVEVPNPEGTAWVWAPKEAKEAVRDGKTTFQTALPLESTTRLPLPRTTYSQTSMSYIVKTHDRRGKFDVKAAEALDVPRRSFKDLTQGKEVQNSKGETIKPEQVLGESILGRGFVVADISGPDFVESFVERPEWSNETLMANVVAIYWLLAPGLSAHPKIKEMMNNLSDIRHVICSQDACPNMVANPSPAELQMKLRRIDPERYPIPKFQNKVDLEAPAEGSNIHFARAGSKTHLMPRLQFDMHEADFPDLVRAWEDVPSHLVKQAEQALQESQDPALLERIESEEHDIPSRDAEIICLGTGSSAPSKHRNVAGTLIRVPGIGNYLLDCGEGTLGQLRRLYGYKETANILRDLKCVVISHLHADHHLGATSLFRAWYEQTIQDGTNAQLAISCINRYRDILAELSQIEDFGFHRLVFPMCNDTDDFPSYRIRHAQDFNGEAFGLSAIKHIKVHHCWRALAQEIQLTSGLRIAYSGDCRPSANFAEHSRGAHLLVHECTFDDALAADAKKKGHSTASEALGVARDMQARRTLLTHFSQRYIKANVLKKEDVKGTLMGTDFMSVKLGDFQKAACFVPVVQSLMEHLGGEADNGEV